MEGKKRYYSSRVVLDQFLIPFIRTQLLKIKSNDFSPDIQSINACNIAFASDGKPVRIEGDKSSKSFLMTKKLDSDMFSQLELVRLLHSVKLLDDDMTPNEDTLRSHFTKKEQVSPEEQPQSPAKKVEEP